MEIKSQTYAHNPEAKFSILIPTWNNLELLQLCVRSIRASSAQEHQIILHINDGSDGSLAWAQNEQIDHSYSAENVGICHALNAAAKLAKTNYICFFNDDMYALPDWDKPFLAEMATLDHARWFLSATMVEPRDTGNPCVIAPKDYGQSPAEFREQELLADFEKWAKADWSGATWPPNLVPKSLWDEVGGYSIEFSPGMYSDPDFSMKLWKVGVRHFKGLGASRVYHFQAKSTGKVRKNNGKKQFLQKWGLASSAFSRYYLRRGGNWAGPLAEPGLGLGFALAKCKSFFKKWF